MAKITFIKPNLETDAVRDPIRTCSYLWIWYMASLLETLWHEVKYMDEIVRNNGLKKQELYKRKLTNNEIVDTKLDISVEDFQKQKMEDVKNLSSENFIKKYWAFKDNSVERIIIKTGNSIEETLQEIEKNNPDIVGIPLIATANYISTTKLAREIKNRFPNIKLITWWQHISAWAKEFLDKNAEFDHVVLWDAIDVIWRIASWEQFEKIIYWWFQELDKFPILNPKLLDDTEYPLDPTYTYPTNWRKSVDFMFSKWCFRKCEFCVAWSQENNHVTVTDYDKIEEQLKIFKDNWVQELVIQDDAFLWEKKNIKEHLPKILSLMKKYWFHWQNNWWMDFEWMDDFVTDCLINYNKEWEWKVTALYIPFNPRTRNKEESASKSMTQRYHKNMENLKRLREKWWIYVFTSAIIGTPEQDLCAFEEELKTDKFLIENGYIDSALALSATMLPWTKWFNENKDNIVNLEDYPGYSLFTTHHRTKNFTPTQIEELMVRWNKELFWIQKTYKRGTWFPNS